MTSKSDWKWFGRAAHYICGHQCRFHLATQVGSYLVSTVGEKMPSRNFASDIEEAEWIRDNWPGEDIGLSRKYETMVFQAGIPCSDVNCNCGIPFTDGRELDFQGYNNAGAATEGHIALCERWANT